MSNNPAPHPSLPARPGGPLPTLARTFDHSAAGRGAGGNSAPGQTHGGAAPLFRPRSVATPAVSRPGWQQNNYTPTVSAPAISSPPVPNNYGPYDAPTYQNQPEYYQQQQYANYTPAGYGNPSPAPPPQIKNPFAAPGQGGAGYPGIPPDPEYEAQLQAWQSAYAVKDKDDSAAKTGGRPDSTLNTNSTVKAHIGPTLSNSEVAAAAPVGSKAAAVISGADGKAATVVRSGGGKTWQDSSLLEWDSAHPRLFIGNLAGEVTDDSLHKAFSKYPSLVKAKVVRDKKSTKSKGYGFVSFQSADDYLKAFKDMQGKYIGSHPILIKKSNTEIKAVDPNKMKQHGKNRGGGQKNRDATSANTGAGVKKGGNKTRNGMVLLG